jgi:hypothetical protein
MASIRIEQARNFNARMRSQSREHFTCRQQRQRAGGGDSHKHTSVNAAREPVITQSPPELMARRRATLVHNAFGALVAPVLASHAKDATAGLPDAHKSHGELRRELEAGIERLLRRDFAQHEGLNR